MPSSASSEEKVSFKPCNRHVLLKEVEQAPDDTTSTILVPDDYKVKTSPYGVYTIVATAADCGKLRNLSSGAKVVVNDAMVENISVEGQNLVLVLENHIYGVFDT